MKVIASVTPNATRFGPLLYPGELERGIAELAEIGYDGIELSLRTVHDIDAPALYRQLEKHDMTLVSIATGQSYLEDGYSLYDSDPAVRAKTVERIAAFVELVAPFSGAVILGGIKGNLSDGDQAGQRSGGDAAIDACLEIAEKSRVTLLLEAINRYETNLFNTVEECRVFIEQRNTEYLRILPDTFHMNIEEVSLRESLDSAAHVIGAIHCADSNRLAPGMGHIDFAAVLKNVAKYDSLIYLGVEVLPLPDSRRCAETAFAEITACLRD